MPDKVLYTAEATSTGDGRSGHVVSSDHRLDLDLAPPVEMGGSGDGTNPEQLFAAGYSACFHSALRLVAGLDREKTRELAEAAHQVCPYSRATRGNISVELRVP